MVLYQWCNSLMKVSFGPIFKCQTICIYISPRTTLPLHRGALPDEEYLFHRGLPSLFTEEHSLMRNVYFTKDYPPSSPRSIPWWGVFILPRTKTIVHRGTLDKREPPRNQKNFAEDNVLSKNIHRGVHANKYSPRSIKFPPRLLGGRKIFTEMLLTDCVGQGLFV